ncbi:hypothetical protein AB4097_01350 [Microvirga sp. 2MCAF35]|uniref:hypothetical protein n=1 Tax=Microvirga sp. 2MCAF35 TaxID=3232987 RepID=UPI003F95292C
MLWAKKAIDPAERDPTQDRFEELFVKLGSPKQMMLAAACDPASGQSILLMSLPNTAYLGLFSGFESVAEDALPSEAALLVGHSDELLKRFRYPARRAAP